MALETLAIAIRENKVIKEIQMKNVVTKMGMYADDVVGYVSNPVVSLRNFSELIGKVGPISGCKINKSVLTLDLTSMRQ